MGQTPAPKQFPAPVGMGGNSNPNVLNTASQAPPAQSPMSGLTTTPGGVQGPTQPQQAATQPLGPTQLPMMQQGQTPGQGYVNPLRRVGQMSQFYGRNL